jgi:hypothetical protein
MEECWQCFCIGFAWALGVSSVQQPRNRKLECESYSYN